MKGYLLGIVRIFYDMKVFIGSLGLLSFFVCLVMIGYNERFSDRKDVNEKNCNVGGKASDDDDSKGILRIVGFWPDKFSLNQRLCVVVAGVSADAVNQQLKDEVERAKGQFKEKSQDYLRVSKIEEDAKKTATGASAAQTSEVQKALQLKKQAQDKLNAALAALNEGLAAVDLSLYIDGRRGPGLTVKAQPISAQQYIFFDVTSSAQAENEEAKFWRSLFGLGLNRGQKQVAIGVSKGPAAADTPQAKADKTATLVVFLKWPLIFGSAALVLLTAWLCIFAVTTSILRDNSMTAADWTTVIRQRSADVAAAEGRVTAARGEWATKQNAQPPNQADIDVAQKALDNALVDETRFKKDLNDVKTASASAAPEDPIGSFSLGRVQMAVWFVLSLAGFCFIWLTTGQFLGVITAQILVLLGIQAATGLAAAQINSDSGKTSVSRGFFKDILSDGREIKLHRLQVTAWTIILATIFAWTVVSNFSFPAFDTNLLLLLGIFNSAYLGFKTAER